LKAESRNLFQLSIFLLSAFAFGSVDHRGHYHHEFIGFFSHRQSVHWSNHAFLAEQLQPQLRFIRLWQRTTKFGNKFLPSVFKTCVFLLISAFQISAFQRFSVSAFSHRPLYFSFQIFCFQHFPPGKLPPVAVSWNFPQKAIRLCSAGVKRLLHPTIIFAPGIDLPRMSG